MLQKFDTWAGVIKVVIPIVFVCTIFFGFSKLKDQAMYKIKITVSGKEITATLNNSKASRDFISLLPLELPLKDYASNEKIGYLSRRLTTQVEANGGAHLVGDVAYYAPWGNLALFYKDTTTQSEDLFILGKITKGKENLHFSGSVTAKIELIK